MKNICEWENCKYTGEFKAPTEKDNSKKFKWLFKYLQKSHDDRH